MPGGGAIRPLTSPLRPLHSADPSFTGPLLAFALALPAARSALYLATGLVSSGLLRPLATVFLLLPTPTSLPPLCLFPPPLPFSSSGSPSLFLLAFLGRLLQFTGSALALVGLVTVNDKILPKSSVGSPRFPLNLPSLQTQREGFMNMLLALVRRLVWVFPLVVFPFRRRWVQSVNGVG